MAWSTLSVAKGGHFKLILRPTSSEAVLRPQTVLCRNCTLPSTVPSAKIDESGLCIYCRQFKGKEDLERKRENYEQRFAQLIEEHKNSGIRSSYDILAAYSGGKDSTFTLDLLKNHYGLRVLAMTFDHGFVSPYALENIRKIVETLGVDYISFKPDSRTMQKIFRFSSEHEFHPAKALERASSICNSCMGLAKFIILKVAIEKRIPFIAYGWSPGQVPLQSAILKNNPSFIRKVQDLFLKPLEEAVGEEVQAYFLDDHHLKEDGNNTLPYNINPLAFLHYDEGKIYQRIRELGWQPPKDTDPNSTNCLLNAFANEIHIQKHQYHPYAMELAELVREGILSREEALDRLLEKPNDKAIKMIENTLCL